MILAAEGHHALPTALALAALAGERDPWARRLGPDLAERLADWRHAPASVERLHRQLCRQLQAAQQPPDPGQAGLCAALAFPDRIAQRRRPGAAELRLANGRGARLADAKAFAESPFLVVWESEDRGSDAFVRLAASLDAATLDAVAGDRVTTLQEVRFAPESGRVVAEARRVLGALVLHRWDTEPAHEAALSCLLDFIRRHGLELLPWTAGLEQLRQRLAFLHRVEPVTWPAVDDTTLIEALDDWLAPWLAGLTSLGELGPDQLRQALLSRLDPARQPDLDRLAPAAWTAPLGTGISIDYGQEPPVLACRLQELLGLDRHPSIMAGRQPLCLHLLSPAGRPIQVTQDLPGFWRGSYAGVRKELRGRYPKHPWPEDPTTATPWRPGLARES